MNILLAEDDKLQNRLIEHHLVGRGFTVRTAFDARAAWESAEQNPPDAILLDLQMPGGTGLNFLKKRNASSRLRNVPVIVITAMEDALVRRIAEQHGAQAIFSKPVDFMLLDVTLESVRSQLTHQGARANVPNARK
ncbi:MAG TPA: response regulator [Candidatus Nitrosotalea sp.]|nr:response regulator [Candidatus Nitrosotalea sp.]